VNETWGGVDGNIPITWHQVRQQTIHPLNISLIIHLRSRSIWTLWGNWRVFTVKRQIVNSKLRSSNLSSSPKWKEDISGEDNGGMVTAYWCVTLGAAVLLSRRSLFYSLLKHILERLLSLIYVKDHVTHRNAPARLVYLLFATSPVPTQCLSIPSNLIHPTHRSLPMHFQHSFLCVINITHSLSMRAFPLFIFFHSILASLYRISRLRHSTVVYLIFQLPNRLTFVLFYRPSIQLSNYPIIRLFDLALN
jgi:hypothetical protein